MSLYPLTKRSSGILLHPTSLPSGKLDDDVYRWLDFLADSGQQVVRDFDELYRRQLRMLYQLLGLLPPSSLDIPISRGSQQSQGESGTMRRNI